MIMYRFLLGAILESFRTDTHTEKKHLPDVMG